MDLLFIIGFSRTGSTLLQRVLNNHSDVYLLPELHFLWPKSIHGDFVSLVRQRIGERISEENVDQLIDLMYSREMRRGVWRRFETQNLDRKILRRKLLNSDRSIRGIFDALMQTTRLVYKRKITGAKFPVHYSYVDTLLSWYPQCKIIHTVRDPRAIFTSQYYKHLRIANGKGKYSIGMTQFIHVNKSIRGVRKMHDRLKVIDNYYVVRYEDMVTTPEKTLKHMCRYLDIGFQTQMLETEMVVNTSLSERKKVKGIKRTSIDGWKQKLPRSLSILLFQLNKVFMESFGYV